MAVKISLRVVVLIPKAFHGDLSLHHQREGILVEIWPDIPPVPVSNDFCLFTFKRAVPVEFVYGVATSTVRSTIRLISCSVWTKIRTSELTTRENGAPSISNALPTVLHSCRRSARRLAAQGSLRSLLECPATSLVPLLSASLKPRGRPATRL